MVPPFLDSYDFIILLGLLNSPTRVPNWRYREYRLFKGASRRRKTLPYYELILAGIPFGSLGVLLVLALAKEIRDEDTTHHHLILFSNLIWLSLQIVAVFLLCYFKIIAF